MTVDFTKSTYTVGGIHAEFVRDLGEGDYPLMFDLYCEITRAWLARALYTRDGEIALSFEGYDLAPPGPPPRNLGLSRRMAGEMHRRSVVAKSQRRIVRRVLFNRRDQTPHAEVPAPLTEDPS